MNPLTNVKNLNKLNERELQMGLSGSGSSWHGKYKDSSWIFVGGLPYDLTEGDVVCIFSQYGELVNINMVRDKATGKTKGFCFICYEDQKSTVLAVDNFNGIKVLGRTLRVDHVEDYKVPKDNPKHEIDEITKKVRNEGIAPQAIIYADEEEEEEETLKIIPNKKDKKKGKKEKKIKKERKKKRKRKESSSDSSFSDRTDTEDEHIKKHSKGIKVEIKPEKDDPAYNKYANFHHRTDGQRADHQNSRARVKQEQDTHSRRRRHNSDSDYEENGKKKLQRKNPIKDYGDDSDGSSDEKYSRNRKEYSKYVSHPKGKSRIEHVDRSRDRDIERRNWQDERHRGSRIESRRERSKERTEHKWERSKDRSREQDRKSYYSSRDRYR